MLFVNRDEPYKHKDCVTYLEFMITDIISLQILFSDFPISNGYSHVEHV